MVENRYACSEDTFGFILANTCKSSRLTLMSNVWLHIVKTSPCVWGKFLFALHSFYILELLALNGILFYFDKVISNYQIS